MVNTCKYTTIWSFKFNTFLSNSKSHFCLIYIFRLWFQRAIKIDISCFSTKHAALRSKSKDCLVQNLTNKIYASYLTDQWVPETLSNTDTLIISEEGWSDFVNQFNPPYFYACPKLGPGFPMTYIMVFFVFNCFRWEVIDRFVDIGEIVDHYCLIFFYKHASIWNPLLLFYFQ